MSYFDFAVSRAIGLLPRAFVGRIAARYFAGPHLSDAMACTRRLNAEGFAVTLDVLGESASSLEEAAPKEAEYLTLLDAIGQENLSADISIKPTALGLLLDSAWCEAAIRRIAGRAAAIRRGVCLDMEDSRCTQSEIDLFDRLRERDAPISLALQAYLLRTPLDVQTLAALGDPLRICKGIYTEPASLLVPGAGRNRRLINEPFLEAVKVCFKEGNFVSIATHDAGLIDDVLTLVKEWKVPRTRFEFQMLLGVCEPLRDTLRDQGFAVRIYVPFGGDWYGYGVRRMTENPRLAGQIARALLRG
ncbi:proline dehydrogenase family protein [Mitsuaria sp. 7]|uniref:proline dehydrogenase family protein n=1 Tax=Mitsuaria sp. 7 TaxID=1658665 RepID=UPI0007DDFE76|nr:proline dehydrogenase family protein [Mitsuaria sp. 7]ANH67397.1 L-proline dehydrogenase [Mitsuaria sp. 7]